MYNIDREEGMNKIRKTQTIVKFIILLVILFLGIKLYADERSEPIDLVIALDKSRSMEEEIEAVKEYIINYIITDRLIVDDYFLVIGFYKEAEVITAGIIYSDKEKEEMKKHISQVTADGSWTDIGSMFDRLRDEFVERLNNNRRKRFLIITDGINEPPKNSPYYTEDGKLKHEYLEKIDNLIVNPGWKVQILALGEDPGSDVFWKDIMEGMGEYTELNDTTSDNINQALEVIGDIKVVENKLKRFNIRGSGKGTLIIPVKTELFNEDPALIINNILVSTPDFTRNMLTDTYTQILPADSTKKAIAEGKGEDDSIIYLKIPVNIGNGLKPGNYQGELTFHFETQVKFKSPLKMTVHVNNIWEDNPWLLVLLIVVAIILLIILIVGIIKLVQGHPIKFKLLVDEMPLPKGKDIFKISRGKNLYILESMDFIRVTEKKNLRCFAKLTVMNEDLKLHVLRDKNFTEPKDIPENILEATIGIITESGKRYHITFSEIT